MRGEGIDNKQLIVAIQELEKEKGIKKDYLLDSIEAALLTAYRRNYNSQENVKVVVDRETGASHLYAVKEVVEYVEKPVLQINLEEAKKIDKTVKQVIIQKLREAEREIIYNEYSERKGEIVSGIIQKADQNIVVMDLGKVEGVMPAKEQIPTESYHVNDKIKGYILNVEKGPKGVPQVIISRACPEFVKKLFEFEIPEIYEGVIEIKGVSRDAGSRSKVAVYSPNENIDPVGSCVGQKGVRIQNIINELNGEKIDVIEWNADLSTYISSALLPAQVMAVDIDEETKVAQVIVPDDQLSLAIGKSGQNARLAAKLAGLSDWRIDIKSESQFRKILEERQAELENDNAEEE